MIRFSRCGTGLRTLFHPKGHSLRSKRLLVADSLTPSFSLTNHPTLVVVAGLMRKISKTNILDTSLPSPNGFENLS